MNKKVLFGLIVVATIVGAYLFLRYSVLKSKDYKPDLSKSKSATDLRPALIAKLQQLVKDGSNGLYNLEINSVEPSVTASTLDFSGLVLTPDTAALAHLDSLHMAPDDVFKVSLKAMHIGGIGISDLLNTHAINLKSIIVDDPIVEVFHKERSYNRDKRLQNDTLPLYKKLTKYFASININNITVKQAQVTSHVATGKSTRYKDVYIQLKNLLIDSTTQHDKQRFLFSKSVGISLGKYSVPTPDGLYYFSCNEINVSAVNRQLTAKGVELTPRYSKEEFQQKTKVRTDRYTIKIPKIVLSKVDWWKLANNENLVMQQADIYNAVFSDYLDRNKPPKKFEIANYPHQAIMKIKIPVFIERVKLHNASVSYEELSNVSLKKGTVYLDNINGEMQNLTNIPAQVRANSFTTFNAKALFMKKVPLNITFRFNLSKVSTGSFTAALTTGAMKHTLLNQLAEPLGLFNIKSGSIKETNATMNGDNYQVNSGFTMLYNDLYVIPLKKDEEEKTLKKRKIRGALANRILIKDDNPGKKGLRKFNYIVLREQHPNFFNQVWKTLLTGILKTIGAPTKLAK